MGWYSEVSLPALCPFSLSHFTSTGNSTARSGECIRNPAGEEDPSKSDEIRFPRSGHHGLWHREEFTQLRTQGHRVESHCCQGRWNLVYGNSKLLWISLLCCKILELSIMIQLRSCRFLFDILISCCCTFLLFGFVVPIEYF